jgi:hypothetical protein
MLGDVGDPEFVSHRSCKLTAHEIIRSRDAFQALHLGWAWERRDSAVTHQDRDEVDAHMDSPTSGQFGVHPPRAIRAAAVDMNFPDERGEPLAAHLGRRHWPISILVVARAGRAKHTATMLHAEPGGNEDVDRQVDPFGRPACAPSRA